MKEGWMIEVMMTPSVENPNEPYFWCLKHCSEVSPNWCMYQAGWAKTRSQAQRSAYNAYKGVMASRGVRVSD